MTNEFPRLMHEHGRKVLWTRDSEIFRCIPPGAIDKATFDRGIDVMIDSLCAVLARVTASERIYALVN